VAEQLGHQQGVLILDEHRLREEGHHLRRGGSCAGGGSVAGMLPRPRRPRKAPRPPPNARRRFVTCRSGPDR
jgi:hypothetical protein